MSTEIQPSEFKKNFDTLKRISENMRNQQDPDIDAIIPQVDEATRAYAVCQNRIDLVKKMLAERNPEKAEG